MAENPDIDFLVPKTSNLSIGYYGLQGLDPDAVLYRACNKDEDISKEILCKDPPNSDRTVEQHIASGSKNPSRHISTTTSSDVVPKRGSLS